MDELELYLALVRRQLRVGRRRAEAICVELRSHLEAQALQFERKGMSREEAVARAVARFGAPNEIAKRLVASNSHYRRDEFLKAMWLGLITGAGVYYVWAIVLYLVGQQSINGVTAWRINVITGGTIGGLSGLAVYVFRARLGTIARVAACVAGVFWIGFIGVMYIVGGYDHYSFRRLVVDLLSCGPIVLMMVTTALAAAHVVDRWTIVTGSARAKRVP